MIILESLQVKSFHFFSKYPKHEWLRTFIRRDCYEYMNKPSMKWSKSTKTADTRKNILTSLITKIKTDCKK